MLTDISHRVLTQLFFVAPALPAGRGSTATATSRKLWYRYGQGGEEHSNGSR
jgi:hypothetical protein